LELFETGMDILLGSDNPSFINSTIEREYSLIESVVGFQGLDKVESNTEKYLRRNNFF
jgi:adenosine deaminase